MQGYKECVMSVIGDLLDIAAPIINAVSVVVSSLLGTVLGHI